jgi:hypothetical protein
MRGEQDIEKRLLALGTLAVQGPNASGEFPLQRFTDQGWQRITELAQRYGVSTDAVTSLLQSVVNGNGSMAQFNHPELGGSGQWMKGGMIMVSDMFNNSLKAKVDGLCTELSALLAQQPFMPPPAVAQSWQGQSQSQGGMQNQQGGVGYGGSMGGVSLFVPPAPGTSSNWWPADLGMPNGTGAQNQVRYAYFNNARRLAVNLNGHVTVYDTLDHQIGGVSQQQGSGGTLTFTSQYGTVPVTNLPVISVNGMLQSAPSPVSAQPAPQPGPPPAHAAQEADIFAKIERLADLQQKGILSPEEFAAKKAELLGRL